MDEPDSAFKRREFLKSLGAAGAGLLLSGSSRAAGADAKSGIGSVPRRKFGRHDLMVSSLCLGGYTLASATSDEVAFRIVDEAIDHGLMFMDNAWDYHQGRAEELMGRALDGKREKVFLMTKACTHDTGGRREAMAMLDESLKRLRTDYLDLWQIHQVDSVAQVERAFGPGGVVEALDEAKRVGKVRFVGFTGHHLPEVHLAMLARKYPFDACQFPLSGFDAHYESFQRKVLPVVIEQGIAPLAIKSLLGNARAVREGVVRASDAIRYVLSLPVATVVTGVDTVEFLRENIRTAAEFVPMDAEEMLAFERQCAPHAADGKWEWYKRKVES
jgi:aryl-alcohol dehydrogenase-like predicted oxidoreductase